MHPHPEPPPLPAGGHRPVTVQALALVVTLQLAVILGLAGLHAYTLHFGDPVLLATTPVDPRDLFRGDYVNLEYEVSALDLDTLAGGDGEYRSGQVVWVALAPGEGPFWQAVAVSGQRPAPSGDTVAVRARVRSVYPGPRPDRGGPGGLLMRVTYGTEAFYVPEGEGRRLERVRDRGRLAVELAVNRFGRPVLRRVLLDGEEVRWR